MNSEILFFLEDIIIVRIKCRSVERLLATLYKNKVKLWLVKIINRHEMEIKIKEKDLEQISKNKTIENISIVSFCGKLKVKKFLKQNKMILTLIVLSYLLLLFLSNVIFGIQVIHSDSEIRNLVLNELNNYKIVKLGLKKNYDKLEQIEENILNKYKDRLEWMEIKEVGTKYIIRVEERKIPSGEEEYICQDIIASKDGIIIKIEADSGVIVKQVNDYVKKGEVIISGEIKNGNEIKNIVKASGKILSEVWYNINVEFPIVYFYSEKTGRQKQIYVLKFLDYNFSLFDFKPYKNKEINEEIVIKHQFLPFEISKQKHEELKIIDKVYTDSEALIKSEELAIEKMQKKLNKKKGEYIISYRKLKYYQENQKIYLDIFFKVCEDITATKEIKYNLEEE